MRFNVINGEENMHNTRSFFTSSKRKVLVNKLGLVCTGFISDNIVIHKRATMINLKFTCIQTDLLNLLRA